MTRTFNRRDLMKGAALTAGAIALIRGGLTPQTARAQGAMSAEIEDVPCRFI